MVYQRQEKAIKRKEYDSALYYVNQDSCALDVSFDCLVGKSDHNIDLALLDKVLAIQQLPDKDREYLMYSIDGLIQHAKTRLAYNK